RQALETLEAYLRVTTPAGDEPLVAYFCAEYGFHESFPIYSGGLGVLAGDYCKAASDERANFVAVGLLYEQGYFTQTVDNDGVQPAVWHLNEGHAAFLILELLREHLSQGLPFNAALEAVAADCVFTTHTPVAAGHDAFGHELIVAHFGDFVRELGVPVERVLDLARAPSSPGLFNMTRLALSGTRHVNGVSRIHGAVSARMLASVRERLQREYERKGLSPAQLRHVTRLLDPQRPGVLTLGFARRFATYKRATLLLRDRARLARLVNNPERPVVLLFAGKAHPADEPGKQPLRELRQLMLSQEFVGRIIFLEDYDLQLARSL